MLAATGKAPYCFLKLYFLDICYLPPFLTCELKNHSFGKEKKKERERLQGKDSLK